MWIRIQNTDMSVFCYMRFVNTPPGTAAMAGIFFSFLIHAAVHCTGCRAVCGGGGHRSVSVLQLRTCLQNETGVNGKAETLVVPPT